MYKTVAMTMIVSPTKADCSLSFTLHAFFFFFFYEFDSSFIVAETPPSFHDHPTLDDDEK